MSDTENIDLTTPTGRAKALAHLAGTTSRRMDSEGVDPESRAECGAILKDCLRDVSAELGPAAASALRHLLRLPASKRAAFVEAFVREKPGHIALGVLRSCLEGIEQAGADRGH